MNACDAACPAEGERAIRTVIQAEVACQLKRQGNANAVGQTNQRPAARTEGFNSNHNIQQQQPNNQKRKNSGKRHREKQKAAKI